MKNKPNKKRTQTSSNCLERTRRKSLFQAKEGLKPTQVRPGFETFCRKLLFVSCIELFLRLWPCVYAHLLPGSINYRPICGVFHIVVGPFAVSDGPMALLPGAVVNTNALLLQFIMVPARNCFHGSKKFPFKNCCFLFHSNDFDFVEVEAVEATFARQFLSMSHLKQNWKTEYVYKKSCF